mmetsp:Transcript_965/g.2353  ORF Transcript_965/g.2353 Transcript_965/m.2353 type:complete len:100 (+) Transcript_965:861-1160(+)
MCPQCNIDHKKMTCEDYQRTLNPQVVQEFDGKRCPHCGVGIALEAGCKFMRCRCGKYFCFLCLDKLVKDDHYSHFAVEGPYGEHCNTLVGAGEGKNKKK